MSEPRHLALEVVKLAGLLVLAVAVQAVLTSHFVLLGVTADLFLILTVLVGITRGSLSGAVFGFAAGILADVIFMDPIGVHGLIFLTTGYLTGRYSEWIPPYSAWAVVAAVACAALGAQFVYGVFQLLTGTGASFLGMVWAQMLPSALVSGLLAAPLYLGLVRIRLIRRLDAPGRPFGR